MRKDILNAKLVDECWMLLILRQNPPCFLAALAG